MFKTLSSDEIAATMQGQSETWPDALIARALEKKREYQDNITIFTITAKDGPSTAPLPPRDEPREIRDEPTAILPRPGSKPSRQTLLLIAIAVVLIAIALYLIRR